MPPRSILVFARGCDTIRKTPFWTGFRERIENTPRGRFVEVGALLGSVRVMQEQVDESLRRGELAALVGMRIPRGGGDWSQIRHFTEARFSRRLSKYVEGRLRSANLPEIPVRYNVEYGPDDVKRDREARAYVQACAELRHRVAPLVILPWFGDNPEQRRYRKEDALGSRLFGVLMAQGVTHFLGRWNG